MTEEYISYWQAVALKECGFDWPCTHYYTKENAADDEVWLTTSGVANWNADDAIPFDKPICSAPTQALAQKWLREVKGMALNVDAHDGGAYTWDVVFLPNAVSHDAYIAPGVEEYPTYEAALSAGIDAALEFIRQK